jgi:signal transduction histidine kinase
LNQHTQKTHDGDRGTADRRDPATRLRRFALQRNAVRESERRRIARILHDEVGQALSALNLGLYRIACRCSEDLELLMLVDDARALLEDAARSARRLAAGFRPCGAEAGTLHAVILATVEHYQAVFGRQCLTAVERDESVFLNQDHATAVQSLLLLALAGIARHGLAALPLISATDDTGVILLELRDQGRGAKRSPTDRAFTGECDALPEFVELEEWLQALDGDMSIDDREARFLLRMRLPLPDRTADPEQQ